MASVIPLATESKGRVAWTPSGRVAWTDESSDEGASEEGRRRIGGPRARASGASAESSDESSDEGASEEGRRRIGGPRARASGASAESSESSERAQRAHLEEIHAAGLVHRASERPAENVERVLPVAAALRPLLPGGVLRRGSTVALPPGPAAGSTSLLFALLAEASAEGSWCALVGLPHLGLVSAAEVGLVPARLALVPYPGPDWAGVLAALIEGVDLVVVATPGPVPAQLASRLTARARQRGAVLMPIGQWPGADLTLEVVGGAWHGLGQGRGRLRRRQLEIRAQGRGAAARPRRVTLTLPGTSVSTVPSLILDQREVA